MPLHKRNIPKDCKGQRSQIFGKFTQDTNPRKFLTKDSSVDKVHEAEVLQQVVLNGSPRYEHSSLGIHGIQCLVGLIVRVLQPVALMIHEL